MILISWESTNLLLFSLCYELTVVDYQLKILSVAISYGGPALLRYKDQLKEAIISAFECPSWKVFVPYFSQLMFLCNKNASLVD